MIEIQIHPSDIRRRVRYFFLDRRAVVTAVLIAAATLFFVILSMAVAPSVIRRVYKVSHLKIVKEQRSVQAVRLKSHVEQMAALEKEFDEQRLRVEKLLAIYGLDEAALGQGGLPERDTTRADELDLDGVRRREEALRRAVARIQQQLTLLADYEHKNAALVREVPSILPLPDDQFVLTSPFGPRTSPFTRSSDFHRGLDLAAPTGTAVFAAADGVVTFSGRVPLSRSVSWWRYGNVVVISHADRFLTIYAHCDSTKVRIGERIRQGQVIATVGSSGWSTNSHLHYEVRSNLEDPSKFLPIDPRIYILNYQWNNEESLLMRKRTAKEYKDFDPLPSAFLGRRRGE
jgi:murein DD-endopeptidase MepM/ murein hydrolase activator NlpD